MGVMQCIVWGVSCPSTSVDILNQRNLYSYYRVLNGNSTCMYTNFRCGGRNENLWAFS